ncbi:MAG: hypothetical protein Kow00121_21720 [Elainellaceae cyanobacterium]
MAYVWYGTDNNDNLNYTGSDRLVASGKKGNDFIWGNNQNDSILGQQGNDTLKGWRGDDYIFGGDDHDKIYGEEGHDKLYGERGNDLLDGGSGNDILNGYGVGYVSPEIDTLIGGAGNDTFVLGDSYWGVHYNEPGDGYAVIQDFKWWEDKIQVKGNASQYELQFKSVNGIGSSAQDTEIYFKGSSGLERIAIVQDTTNVIISADFTFV